jgi:hypothetical protein
MPIDDAWLQPFTTLVTGIADVEASMSEPALGVAWHMERAVLDTPLELSVEVAEDGSVALATAPPTQHVETTYMPVFHQIRMTVAADVQQEDEDAGGR